MPASIKESHNLAQMVYKQKLSRLEVGLRKRRAQSTVVAWKPPSGGAGGAKTRVYDTKKQRTQNPEFLSMSLSPILRLSIYVNPSTCSCKRRFRPVGVFTLPRDRPKPEGHGLHAADGREEMRELGVHINSTLYSETSPRQIIETLRAVTCSCLSHPALHITGTGFVCAPASLLRLLASFGARDVSLLAQPSQAMFGFIIGTPTQPADFARHSQALLSQDETVGILQIACISFFAYVRSCRSSGLWVNSPSLYTPVYFLASPSPTYALPLFPPFHHMFM